MFTNNILLDYYLINYELITNVFIIKKDSN